MQNGNSNGELQRVDNVDPESKGRSGRQFKGWTRANNFKDDPDVTTKPDDGYSAGPPLKKRKFASSSGSSTPRPPSPPWKKPGVEGPTSFTEAGKRRSTRTNVLPVELHPHSDKRHTRAAQKEYADKRTSSRAQTSADSPHTPASARVDTNGKRHSRRSLTGGADPALRQKSSGLRTASSSHLSHAQPSKSQQSSPSKSRTRLPVSSTKSKYDTPGGRGERRLVNSPGSGTLSTGINGHSYGDIEGSSPTKGLEQNKSPQQKLPRLRLKVKMPTLEPQHPLHVLRPKSHASFQEWLEDETASNNRFTFATPAAALQEARLRARLQEADRPGDVLSRDKCSYYLSDPEEEPPRQYSHQDHFAAYASKVGSILGKARKERRHKAKVLAHACAEVWRKRNKDPEDILKAQQEETRRKHRQVVKDLQRQFDLVRAEVERRKLARWEAEKKAKNQVALNKAIKQSTMLFKKRRSDAVADEDAPSDDEETDLDDDESSSGSENDSNMSDTEESGDEHGDAGIDDDATLTPAELQLKYSGVARDNDLPHPSDDEGQESSSRGSPEPDDYTKAGTSTPPPGLEAQDVKMDEVDPLLMDDSDESTDMNDDIGDTEEEEGDLSEDESDSNDQEPGLLGLFSAKEIEQLKTDRAKESTGSPPADSSEILGALEEQGNEHDQANDNDEIVLAPNGSQGPDVTPDDNAQGTTDNSTEPLPNDDIKPEFDPETTSSHAGPAQKTQKPVDQDTIGSNTPAKESTPAPGSVPATELTSVEVSSPHEGHESADPTSDIKTKVPHLLRGTLREYQHYGLDWLAGLYTSNINGILADEMGLGKTIQTIALLAHLAIEHEVWGPHLVVVPTSVMLNWEMEFKKWCPGFKILTYYGNQEERRQKRKGWMDDDRWHVCITSYQLVLQDQQVFKRRNWHYMVLDEAHNIKNFRSQRWQTLLTFKTQARLLLTGTPLQNNLTELWSLLFFLMPSDGDSTDVDGFADLREFSEWFRRPVEHILEHGRETMDEEAKKVVSKLHTVLRPYILRRLKADVEKQMPGKFEHVISCRLSKRQRHLYDGFMSRAQTKETLASGNYLSIINCLMQLRKVCNHPDLFETRPITTSFAMSKSAFTDYEIKELLVRRRLLQEDTLGQVDFDFLNLAPVSREETSKRLVDDSIRIMAYNPLRKLRERQYNRTNWDMGFDGSTVRSTLISMDNEARKSRMAELERCLYFESKRHGRRPIYGKSLIDILATPTGVQRQFQRPLSAKSLIQWLSFQSPALQSMVLSLEERAQTVEPLIQKFGCVTPAVVAREVTNAALTPIESRYFTPRQRVPAYDPFHEPQMRLSIAFPDKRLLQYDCGKLQQLDKLLRRLQAEGHRALIFTQMTKMLDILEQFLNIHGHRYLRLDGATKIEQRQMLTERFNSDSRILAFILSSRSGGLGINLTGADTVIFYDLDWNPAMDKQCQDRCHRIGQTRDVHIYRFVSEYTIESNILRKANQKRMLDDVVIQEGEFTTDYFQKLDVREMFPDDLAEGRDEAAAAMDRVLDTRTARVSRVFEQAEDKEDIDAAKTAEKEVEHADDADFEEGSATQTPGATGQDEVNTPMPTETGEEESTVLRPSKEGSMGPTTSGVGGLDSGESQFGHIDDYLLNLIEWQVKDEPPALLIDKSKKKSRRGKEHRLRRHR